MLGIVLLASCTVSEEIQFNDKDIKITLTNLKKQDEYSSSYTIEIKNEGQLELKNLYLFLYYPILTNNGSRTNPFKVEAKPDAPSPINLKKGQRATFVIFAPHKEVFGDSELLDLENPAIELKGIVVRGGKELPFEKSGISINNM